MKYKILTDNIFLLIIMWIVKIGLGLWC